MSEPIYGQGDYKYWVLPSYGGWGGPFNPRLTHPGWLLPNCTSYCWGRWSQVNNFGSKAPELNDLPTTNAQYWIGNHTLNWEVTNTPKEHCICVWEGTDGVGHVSFVEEIVWNSNGKASAIIVSESNANAYNNPSRASWAYHDREQYTCDGDGIPRPWAIYTFKGFLVHKEYQPGDKNILLLLFLLAVLGGGALGSTMYARLGATKRLFARWTRGRVNMVSLFRKVYAIGGWNGVQNLLVMYGYNAGYFLAMGSGAAGLATILGVNIPLSNFGTAQANPLKRNYRDRKGRNRV